MRRFAAVPPIVFAAILGLILTQPTPVTTAADPRLDGCGASISGNRVLAAVEIARPNKVWDVLPALGKSPELEDAKGPALLVIFDGVYSGPWVDETGRQARVNDAICVVDGDGNTNIYFNVSRQGLNLPSE